MQPNDTINHTLPSFLTMETVEAAAEALMKLPLGTKFSLALDASALENISSSGAQILLALEKTMNAAQGDFHITGQKNFLTQVFQELGLGRLTQHLR